MKFSMLAQSHKHFVPLPSLLCLSSVLLGMDRTSGGAPCAGRSGQAPPFVLACSGALQKALYGTAGRAKHQSTNTAPTPTPLAIAPSASGQIEPRSFPNDVD